MPQSRLATYPGAPPKIRGRTLQKSNHRDTEYTEKKTQRRVPTGSSNPPGTRTSSDMVKRETCSKNQFLSPASLLAQHASRATGLRGTSPETDLSCVGLIRPNRRSPRAEGLYFDGDALRPGRWAGLLLKPAKRVGECRDRPWVVLCVSLCPLCLCGEFAARPCGHLASKAELFGSGFPGEAR
jgi:hypothetical protein